MSNSRYSGLDLRRAKYGRKMGQIYLSRHLLCGIRMWYKLNLFAFLYDENLIIWFYCFAIFTLWSHLNPMKIPKLEPLYQILYHINEIMISLYIWYLNFYQIFCYVWTPWKCVWLFYKRSRVVQMTSAATTVGSSVYLKFKSDIIAGALTPGKSWN